MVGDSSSFILFNRRAIVNNAPTFSVLENDAYQNVDLATEDVLCLLEGVVCGSLRSGFNLVEARGEMCGGLGFRSDGVEVGQRCVLALGKGNKLVTSAFDHSEGDEVSRHLSRSVISDLERSYFHGPGSTRYVS